MKVSIEAAAGLFHCFVTQFKCRHGPRVTLHHLDWSPSVRSS